MDMQAVAVGLKNVASSLGKLPGARQIVLSDLSVIAAGFAQQEDMTPDFAADKAIKTYRCLLINGAERQGASLADLVERVVI